MALFFVLYLVLECVATLYMVGRSIHITRRTALCVTSYNLLLIAAILWGWYLGI